MPASCSSAVGCLDRAQQTAAGPFDVVPPGVCGSTSGCMTPPLDEFECRMMVVLTLDVAFYVFLLKEGEEGEEEEGELMLQCMML